VRRIAIGAVCAAALLAACGAGDETMLETATEPPAGAVSTTAPESTTSAAPTTTLPETTTTLSIDDQLTQALDAYWAGYYACGADPANCDFSYLAEQGPIREIAKGFVGELVARDWRLSRDVRGSRVVVVAVDVRGDEATVQSCRFDAGIVLGPDGPDGQRTTVNDEERSTDYVHRFYVEAGAWKVGEERIGAALGDGDKCGF
jgi:hypothetical protein